MLAASASNAGPEAKWRAGPGWDGASPRRSPVLVDILEGLGVVNGEDAEESLPRPHVLVSHGAVLLLPRCVQDVQQTGLSINDHLLSVGILPGDGEKVLREGTQGEVGSCHPSAPALTVFLTLFRPG